MQFCKQDKSRSRLQHCSSQIQLARMSDYDESFDDSFDSGSESDHADGGAGDEGFVTDPRFTTDPRFITQNQPALTGVEAPIGIAMKDFLILQGGNGGRDSLSDHDDFRLKEDRSPKPKKKFGSNFGSNFSSTFKRSVRKPNMANIKQKIKNKLRKDLPIFGSPLDVAIQRSLLGADGIELPTVFRECISYLEEHWLDHEGLYRLPGVKSKVEDAKARYDRGEVVDLDDYDPNVVASLLKLYLRELPDPLVTPRVTSILEAAAALPREDQVSALMECMEETPIPNKLMLAWIIEHIGHITQHSATNKMSLPNLVIVFSPTLQLSAPILHTLYNNAREVFGEVELAKYEKPAPSVEKKMRRAKMPSMKDFDDLNTEEEISAELDKLMAMLDKLHSKMAGKFDEQRNEVIWEVQRAITELRRKKKILQKKPDPSVLTPGAIAGGEDEFMKTLLLMEATLAAENEELMSKKEKLQAEIRKETDLIDHYKRLIQEKQARLADSYEESGDEGELASKVATLKWHGKELELRNRNLVQSIKEEEDEIIQLKVKLRVLPLKQKLNADE